MGFSQLRVELITHTSLSAMCCIACGIEVKYNRMTLLHTLFGLRECVRVPGSGARQTLRRDITSCLSHLG